LLERGIAIRKGIRPLRAALPQILTMTDKLSPRMLQIIEALATDWRRLDERIEAVSSEIEALAEEDNGRERLMTVPGIGPIISSATVAAIGMGDVFSNGRDFGAWLGLVCHYQRSRMRDPIATTGSWVKQVLQVERFRLSLSAHLTLLDWSGPMPSSVNCRRCSVTASSNAVPSIQQ
jgi:transposase